MTVTAYLGGAKDFVAAKMWKDGIYDEFIDVITVSQISLNFYGHYL